MLEAAAIGVSILQSEGLYVDSLKGYNILLKNINDVLDTLLKPNKLKATLRN